MTLTPAQLRRHALILRERAPEYPDPQDREVVLAQAAKLEAEADLADARAGVSTGIADSAEIVREYPIIGRVVTEGGIVKSVEHPYGETEIAALARLGIYIAWEWSYDPASGVDEGRLYRIYVGTVPDGPRLCWDNGGWRRLRSHGNYGKRYAYGGTWSSERRTYVSLDEADPELAAQIYSAVRVRTEKTGSYNRDGHSAAAHDAEIGESVRAGNVVRKILLG